jgi:hypothetical protein
MTKANNVVSNELKWTPCCYGHDMLLIRLSCWGQVMLKLVYPKVTILFRWMGVLMMWQLTFWISIWRGEIVELHLWLENYHVNNCVVVIVVIHITSPVLWQLFIRLNQWCGIVVHVTKLTMWHVGNTIKLVMWHIVIIVDTIKIQRGLSWIYDYINGHLGSRV